MFFFFFKPLFLQITNTSYSGFSHNVIPYNYLNCVLTDEQKGIIQKNLKILEGVLSEGPGGELDKNILSTIRSVYKIIGPFVRVGESFFV